MVFHVLSTVNFPRFFRFLYHLAHSGCTFLELRVNQLIKAEQVGGGHRRRKMAACQKGHICYGIVQELPFDCLVVAGRHRPIEWIVNLDLEQK